MASLILSLLAAALACVPVLLIWDTFTALMAVCALTLMLWPLLALVHELTEAFIVGIARLIRRCAP
ncbi:MULTISPECIES: hypothetical protein [Tepidiphilus]|jgi:succinate-acetate transporter protein|uniref:Uncharacterized protein n=1 Tax=Tepidiphilus baoligensis TaxID=2698687 RepID=A0ABX1QMR2_9PROT|nr:MULTISPECIES: hypothetical protein [Tepidiphilus]NMH16453.1 hypothetical protein [Tepidiphilus baoligensis]